MGSISYPHLYEKLYALLPFFSSLKIYAYASQYALSLIQQHTIIFAHAQKLESFYHLLFEKYFITLQNPNTNLWNAIN